jgi:hypothetical protein
VTNSSTTTPSIFDVRVRLLPDDPIHAEAYDRSGARPFAEGIVQTLSLRDVDGDRALDQQEVLELDWDIDSTWASAWAQTRTLESPEEINVVDASGVEIVHLYAEHGYGASFAPFLDDIFVGNQAIGENGALVSMPVDSSVIVHPIRGDELLEAAQAMIPITRQVHGSGPGSLSAHLYWWRNGTFTWVPTYFARDGVEFYPPVELADLIDQHHFD